jgi:hypothetical protein
MNNNSIFSFSHCLYLRFSLYRIVHILLLIAMLSIEREQHPFQTDQFRQLFLPSSNCFVAATVPVEIRSTESYIPDESLADKMRRERTNLCHFDWFGVISPQQFSRYVPDLETLLRHKSDRNLRYVFT